MPGQVACTGLSNGLADHPAPLRMHGNNPMTKIYLSSTYEDLKDYREAVARALRRLDHHVGGMENYVAADERPLKKCLKDVEKCDVYVGIFASRYGYVPAKDNPNRKSITELEYRQAN